MSQYTNAPTPGDQSDNGCQGYHGLVFKAPIGIFISTPDGRFTGANPELSRMLGYKKPQYLVDFVRDIATQIFADPSEYKEVQHLLDEYGKVENHECRLLRKDGSFFWASINLREVRDQNGKASYCQGFVSDITKHKMKVEELHSALNEHTCFLQYSPIGMFIMDRKRRVLKANRAAALFAGRELREMINLSLGEALRCAHHQENPSGCGSGQACKVCGTNMAILDTLEQGCNKQNIEACLSLADGSKPDKRHLLINTAYFKLDHGPALLLCAQDITSIKGGQLNNVSEEQRDPDTNICLL